MYRYRQNFKQKYRNGIFTNITTFIQIQPHLSTGIYFCISISIQTWGKHRGNWKQNNMMVVALGWKKNIKHQLHQKKTSNKDKHKINADYVHGLWKKLKSAKNLTNHNTVEVSAHAPVRGIWTSNYL